MGFQNRDTDLALFKGFMYYFLLILLLIFVACKDSQPKYDPVEKRGYNSLESYVRVPTDKARELDKKVNKRNEDMVKDMDAIQ